MVTAVPEQINFPVKPPQKPKHQPLTSWNEMFRDLERRDIADLSKNVHKKVGRPIPCGKAIMCKACNRSKNASERKRLMLRRSFCPEHWKQRAAVEIQTPNFAIMEVITKVRIGSQPAIELFLKSSPGNSKSNPRKDRKKK